MQYNVEIYFKPKKPVDYHSINSPLILSEDFSDRISKQDKEKIKKYWDNLEDVKKGRIFSKDKSLGILFNTKDCMQFKTSEYMTYNFVVNANDVDKEISQKMRVASIGGLVKSLEGDVIIQKRSKYLSHSPNKIDSSVGGFCVIQNNKLDFEKNLYGKLKKELGIIPREVISAKITGIHTCHAPDYSGMYSFVVQTCLPTKELKEKGKKAVDNGNLESIMMINLEELSSFIVNTFKNNKKDICPDACIVLSNALSYNSSLKTMQKLQEDGMDIKFGELKKENFIESATPYKI